MTDAIAFLLWLIFVGISAIMIGYFLKYHGNTPTSKEAFVVYSCPPNTTNYITSDGETNCCNGDVVNGVCTGNDICTLSPKKTGGLQTCIELNNINAAAAGAAQCPSDIPNYFSMADQSFKGCSVSRITPDGTAPSDPSMLQCILYATPQLDSTRLDSCQNY